MDDFDAMDRADEHLRALVADAGNPWWPDGDDEDELPLCSRCGKPWEDHYKPALLKFKNGPHGTFGLSADHTPHIEGVHAPI